MIGRSDEDAALVGQVLMPYAHGNSATDVDPASAVANLRLAGMRTPAEMVAEFRVGGMILVGFAADDPTGSTNPAVNVENPRQVRALTDGLRSASANPLLIGTDQEHGTVTRIREGVTLLPSAMGFGAAGRPELTSRAWAVAGFELAAMGINADFAPVADTLGPDGNTSIGSRSFGADPVAVSVQVAAAVAGLRTAGMAATLKHFPGHGHTAADSHRELPVVSLSRAEWEERDRPPFAAGIAAGAQMVMSGHLDVRALDPGTPATFSAPIMTGVLREELGFTGVAVTDSLTMVPARRWPPGEAAVRALLAGNDLLLMPPSLIEVRDGILAALEDGRLPRARLVEAAGRVRALAASLGAPPASEQPGPASHHRVVREVAAAAVTLLRGSPLVTGPVTVTASDGREAARSALAEALAESDISHTGGTIVHLVGYGDDPTDLNPAADVTVSMDKPDLLAVSSSPTLIATYSSSPSSMSALADVLNGKAPAPGRVPVPFP